LIINKLIKPDINYFSLDYKEDKTIKPYIKLAFHVFEKDITLENKFKKLSQALDWVSLGDIKKEEELMDYFYTIQKTYNNLNRFVYNYKYKKTKIVVDTDMGLNKLTETDKNVISIIDNNSKYLFHVNDLIQIINTALTNSHLFFSEPKSVKNPYNNLPFNKSTLYNIYFYIRYKTNYYPELLFKFFECNFNLTRFKFLNENLIREYIIFNHVYKSPTNSIKEDIKQMISNFNFHCQQIGYKNRIIIDKDFPVNKLVTIMKPYLFLYCKSLYSFHPQIKKQFTSIFKTSMLKFNNFNPQFGRKRYKLQYRVTKSFKKRMCGKEIVFDDKCVKYYDNNNEMFLSDHLKYCESEDVFVLNDSSEYDDDNDTVVSIDNVDDDTVVAVDNVDDNVDDDTVVAVDNVDDDNVDDDDDDDVDYVDDDSIS